MRPSDAVAGEETAAAVTPHDGESQIDAFRDAVRRGGPWFNALLALIAGWDLPAETVDGREYRYLIGGEAFDWLLLAERVCNAVEAERLLPQREVEALLLAGEPPQALAEADLRRRLGPAKYRAHLNFLYGVQVEEALQLAVEQQVQKERRSGVLGSNARMEIEIFHRIYGAGRVELLGEFRTQRSQPLTDRISLTELREFTYWLFKRRLAVQDPARVASDTRRGLLMLQRLEELKGRRPVASVPPEAGPLHAVDSVALPVR